jgi:predicted DNA-binding transcriptional regulator YafY
MPINKDALLRYLSIDLRLRKTPSPSLDELKSFVEKEMTNFNQSSITVSKETLKKDIQTLRFDFGSPIDYDRTENHYYYINSDYTFLNLGDNLIKKLITKIKLDSLVLNKIKFEEFIQFEEETSNLGWDNILDISTALSLRKKIQLQYNSKNSLTQKKLILNPLLLKENRNYWYLLATIDNSTEIRTFNLSRILGKIVVLDENSVRPKDFNPLNYFKYSIGITAQKSNPEEITLSFTPNQSNYLIEKPLHKTQTVLVNTENEFIIKLTVEPNYELIANILSYGENVKVISPNSLKELIIQKISLMEKNYKNG